PAPVGGRFGADTLVPRLPPVRRDGDLGPLVAWPDHASREGQEHGHQEDEPGSDRSAYFVVCRSAVLLWNGHVVSVTRRSIGDRLEGRKATPPPVPSPH